MPHLELDHVGVAARHLDMAQAAYARLGFHLAPRSMHSGALRPGGPVEPWASGNHCAMFARGGYLEVVGLVQPTGHSTIGAAVERYEGVHIVAFGGGATAEAMHRRLREDGVEAEAPRALERDAAFGSEGTQTRRARFSNVYVAPQSFPDARFLFIEHLTPEVLWQPHLLAHPNGVTALVEVGFASDDATASAERLRRLSGVAPEPTADGGSRFALGRTRVEVLTGDAWRARLPGARQLPSPSPVWIGFEVESLAATRDFLRSAGVAAVDRGDGDLWVLPQEAAGAALRFGKEAR